MRGFTCSKQKPGEKKEDRVGLDVYSFAVNFKIKRTFICKAPLFLVANSVAQSTTEAVRSNSNTNSRASNTCSNFLILHEFLCLTGNTRSMITRLSWKGTSYHCVWPQIVVDRERANVVRMSTLQVFQQAERPHGFKDFIASRADQPVLHTHCQNMRTSTLPFTAILAKLLKRIRMMTITT